MSEPQVQNSLLAGEAAPRLDELDYDEMRDAARVLAPQEADDEFEEAFRRFEELKRLRAAH
jgi:hypothetical protein